MKRNASIVCAALALALGWTVHAEDSMLLRAKVQLLAEQAKDLYEDSFRKGSDSYGVPYQYYFGLMYASGTNLLARADTTATTQRLKKYCTLIEKDYEAYTRIDAAAKQAAATGSDKVFVGRHVVKDGARKRARRLVNAEKLRDKELAAAVKRWETLVIELKKNPR